MHSCINCRWQKSCSRLGCNTWRYNLFGYEDPRLKDAQEGLEKELSHVKDLLKGIEENFKVESEVHTENVLSKISAIVSEVRLKATITYP